MMKKLSLKEIKSKCNRLEAARIKAAKALGLISGKAVKAARELKLALRRAIVDDIVRGGVFTVLENTTRHLSLKLDAKMLKSDPISMYLEHFQSRDYQTKKPTWSAFYIALIQITKKGGVKYKLIEGDKDGYRSNQIHIWLHRNRRDGSISGELSTSIFTSPAIFKRGVAIFRKLGVKIVGSPEKREQEGYLHRMEADHKVAAAQLKATRAAVAKLPDKGIRSI